MKNILISKSNRKGKSENIKEIIEDKKSTPKVKKSKSSDSLNSEDIIDILESKSCNTADDDDNEDDSDELIYLEDDEDDEDGEDDEDDEDDNEFDEDDDVFNYDFTSLNDVTYKFENIIINGVHHFHDKYGDVTGFEHLLLVFDSNQDLEAVSIYNPNLEIESTLPVQD